MKIKIAVLDDNVTERMEIFDLINNVIPDLGRDFSVDAFSETDELLSSGNNYLIIFLDIELKRESGIEAAERIRAENKNCLFFFVTNYENYMDYAMNKTAFRFWTKPINKARLIYGLESALVKLDSMLLKVKFRYNNNEKELPVYQVICVSHDSRQTCVATISGTFKTYDTYKEISSQLTQPYFVQTDKGTLVNLNYVIEYTKGCVVCSYGENDYTMPLSRRRYANFKKAFSEWGATQG